MITRTQQTLLCRLPERVINRITIDENGCWLWEGELNRNGYGRIKIDGGRYMIHRYVWHHLGRALDDDQVLDHCCRVRRCCNPTHLSAVTVQHNTRRGRAVLFKKR